MIILILFLGIIFVIIEPKHWSIFNVCTSCGSLISILILILILGWVETDSGRVGWSGRVGYRELSDGGAGHRDLSLLFATTIGHV